MKETPKKAGGAGNLKPCGQKRKPRILPAKEAAFCASLERYGSQKRACLDAGYKPNSAWHLLEKPRIKARLEKLEADRLTKESERVDKAFTIDRETFLADLYWFVKHSKNHFAAVKAGEVIARIEGYIEAAHTTVSAQASADVRTIPELYLAPRFQRSPGIALLPKGDVTDA